MKTAAEFFDEGNFNNVTDMLIEFAKMHVQEALQSAYDYHTIEKHKKEEMYDYPNVENFRANKDSILNAYPLDLIK